MLSTAGMRSVIFLVLLLVWQSGYANAAASCSNASGLVTVGVDRFIANAEAGITAANQGVMNYLINGLMGSYPINTPSAGVCTADAAYITCINSADQVGNNLSQEVAYELPCLLANGCALTAASSSVLVGTTNLATFSTGGTAGTLAPGVYYSGSTLACCTPTKTLTLNGQGNPNAAFVFIAGSTAGACGGGGALTTSANSNILLTNGTQACNVFWILTTALTIGANNTFVGTVYAGTSITFGAGVTATGRFYAGTALTLGGGTNITSPNCTSATGYVQDCAPTVCDNATIVTPTPTPTPTPTATTPTPTTRSPPTFTVVQDAGGIAVAVGVPICVLGLIVIIAWAVWWRRRAARSRIV